MNTPIEQSEQAICSQIEKELTEQYGAPRENSGPGLRWLTGDGHIPNCLDHPDYRLKDGKRTFTGAPYDLAEETKAEAYALAEKKGLQVIFKEPPSNYNDTTYLVILTEQGAEPTQATITDMGIKQKSTCPPLQCNHCQRIWYGVGMTSGDASPIPPGVTLCAQCYDILDLDLCASSGQYLGSLHKEHIDSFRLLAAAWIADKTQKPFPREGEKRFHRNVPKWMRRALDLDLVKPNETERYIIYSRHNEPVRIDKRAEGYSNKYVPYWPATTPR